MGPHFLVFSALFPSEIDDHSFKSTFSKIKKSNPVVERMSVWLKNACIIKISSRLFNTKGAMIKCGSIEKIVREEIYSDLKM